MPKTLTPIAIGEIIPIRRIKNVSMPTRWDESTNPPQTKVSIAFEYEIIFTDSTGKQVCEPKHDGYVSLQHEEARALAEFALVYAAISNVGQALKDARETPPAPPAAPAPGPALPESDPNLPPEPSTA
jgi:ABC-type Fe3+-hydroxamate transport system substrate-binding protein